MTSSRREPAEVRGFYDLTTREMLAEASDAIPGGITQPLTAMLRSSPGNRYRTTDSQRVGPMMLDAVRYAARRLTRRAIRESWDERSFHAALNVLPAARRGKAGRTAA